MLTNVSIQDVWDDIRPAIEDIRSKMPWTDWRPEDIYSSCSKGESAIFCEEGVPPGESFFIAKISQSGKDKILFIWIAWSPKEEGATLAQEAIETLAINNGCNAVEFVTHSERLVQYASQFGYSKVMYEVRKDIDLPVMPLPEDAPEEVPA